MVVNTGLCGDVTPTTIPFTDLSLNLVDSNPDPENPDLFLTIYTVDDYGFTIEVRTTSSLLGLVPCPTANEFSFLMAEYSVKIINSCEEEYTVNFYWPYPLC